MKTNYIVAAITLTILLLVGAVTYNVYKNRSSDTIDIDELPIPSPQEGFASPSSTPSSLGINSQPAAGESDNSEGDLQIMEPGKGEYLTNPFRVRGYMNKSASEVQISVRSANGEKIAEKTVPCNTTLDPDTCEFSVLFEDINPGAKSGKIEAVTAGISDAVSVNFN